MKVLVSQKSGREYMYKGEGEFHCKEGYFREEDLHSGSSVIYTVNTGLPFYCFTASKADMMRKLRRGPQILTAKDIGYIAARCALETRSRVIEAGGGSGGASIGFARIVKDLRVYERREEHLEVLKKNLDYMGMSHVQVKETDIKENIGQEAPADLLFLDLPDPEEILREDLGCLESGAFIVCYLPSIVQVQNLVDFVREDERFYDEEVSEVGVRQWKVSGRAVRPENRKEIDHTAFLVFIRKL